MPLLELSPLFPFRFHFGNDLRLLLSDLFVHLGTLAWFVTVQFCLEEDCVSHVFPEFLTSWESRDCMGRNSEELVLGPVDRNMAPESSNQCNC